MPSGSIRKVWSDAELDEALATLHSGPGTRQDELARTRAALLRAAGEVDDDLLPVSGPERPAKKRAGSWRWIAAAAAAALVPGGVVVATNIFVDNGQDTAAHATSAPGGDILDDIRGTDVAVRDGQFRLVTDSTWATRFSKDASVIYQTHEIFERWNPSDRKKQTKIRFTRTGEIRWLRGDYGKAQAKGDAIPGAMSEVMYADGEAVMRPTGPGSENSGWPPSGPPVATTTTSERTPSKPTTTTGTPPSSSASRNDDRWQDGGWAKPSAKFLAGLPTDPSKLLDRLRTDDGIRVDGPHPGKPNSAPEIFEMAYTALRAGYGFGDLRVALCKALGKVPGINLKPDTITADGRKGISYSIDLAGQTREIVVDPATATVMTNRAIATDNGKPAPVGTILFETTTTVKVTDTDGS
jgi:hypothetical protein